MSKEKKYHSIQNLIFIGTAIAGVYITMKEIVVRHSELQDIDEGNPYFQQELEKGEEKYTTYESIVKPAIDKVLSFGGLILLLPVFAAVSIAIYIDDPGPIFFTQKRVGKDKHFFLLHKFRSMKMSTPHDVPTHQLSNPEQYITRVGKVLRKTSLDELPQIWDIFRGKMSIIGPRPALWNQNDLVAERDKYEANGIYPGLTGLAQIKGRDKLEISDKAKYDGEYLKILRKGGMSAFWQDIKCFVQTITSVIKCDGIVEGGTGGMLNTSNNLERSMVEPVEAGFEEYGYKKIFYIDKKTEKRVLITGANSYIGGAFSSYVKQHYPNLIVETLDMKSSCWREADFSRFDTVFHVAGIAHADIGKVSETEKKRYYEVNTDLAIETCKKCKNEGVSQFIFMSSMIVYGDSASYGVEQVIDEKTVPAPTNFYGDSKWQADVNIRKLSSDSFHVAVLRPPLVYGKGAKGNYSTLVRLANILPIFPLINNQRSMIYIDNLCEFVSLLTLSGEGGIYFPQNPEYSSTSEMIKEIGSASGRRIVVTRLFNPVVEIASYIPGKVSKLINKGFGNSTYTQKISTYNGLHYQIYNLKESIETAEGTVKNLYTYITEEHELTKYSVLMSIYRNDKLEYVKEAIDSMLRQTLPCDQFVIVEDGPILSDLEKLINDYELLQPEVFTIVRLEKNGGLGNALNQGIEKCRNELIARMDADDISEPTRCKQQVDAFQSDPTLAIVGTQINEFVGRKNNVVSSRIVPVELDDIKKFARRRSPFNHVTVMYRKSVLKSFGGYVAFYRKEDLELFIKMINSGANAKNIDEPLVAVRISDDSLGRRKSWRNCKEYIDIMYNFYKRGYLGKIDFMFVLLGQITMCFAPKFLISQLNNRFLRKV